jgi:hypothetical protein
MAWFAQFKRIIIRYERRLDILAALHSLAAALIGFRQIRRRLG